MAALTIKRAKWWAVALPSFAAAVVAVMVAWLALDLPMWHYSPRGPIHVSAGSLAYGGMVALCTLLAALVTGINRTRPLPTLAALLWLCSIGVWIDTAGSWVWALTGYSQRLAYVNDVPGIAVMGLGTAISLGWMTASRSVAVRSGGVAAITIGASVAYGVSVTWWWSWIVAEYVGLVPFVFWPIAIAFVLGRFVLAEGKRRAPGLCAGCGYDLGGLPAGTSCPECGPKPA